MTVIDVQVQDMSNGYSVVVMVEKEDGSIWYDTIAHIFCDKYLDKAQAKTWANKIGDYHRKELIK